jgi:hypothetical protein
VSVWNDWTETTHSGDYSLRFYVVAGQADLAGFGGTTGYRGYNRPTSPGNSDYMWLQRRKNSTTTTLWSGSGGGYGTQTLNISSDRSTISYSSSGDSSGPVNDGDPAPAGGYARVAAQVIADSGSSVEGYWNMDNYSITIS